MFLMLTQKVFIEIEEQHANGLGVNLSFIGNYNPALDINELHLKQLTI